jgi:transcriptional regulator with XRE-family HTH domain
MDIGDNIKEVRKAKGMSQKQIALSIGIDQAQYSRIESGKVEPTISSLEKIATALGVELSAFFSSQTALEVSMEDKSLIEKAKLLDELDDEEKNSIFNIIEGLISKKRMRDSLSNLINA